jgi:hypothetical protein
MPILACRIRLPDLNGGISNQRSVRAEDATDYLNYFALRTVAMAVDAREVEVMIGEGMFRVEWPEHFLRRDVARSRTPRASPHGRSSKPKNYGPAIQHGVSPPFKLGECMRRISSSGVEANELRMSAFHPLLAVRDYMHGW